VVSYVPQLESNPFLVSEATYPMFLSLQRRLFLTS
jgi:hypothetical protein